MAQVATKLNINTAHDCAEAGDVQALEQLLSHEDTETLARTINYLSVVIGVAGQIIAERQPLYVEPEDEPTGEWPEGSGG